MSQPCRQAEMLAAQVPLFYSLPMLGLTMLKALCSSPPPGLLPGVADPAQAMEKAIEATNLQAFMDLLAQPMVERCAGLLSDTLDTVMAAQVTPHWPGVLPSSEFQSSDSCVPPHDLFASPIAPQLPDAAAPTPLEQEAPNRASVLEKHAWMRRLARNQELVKQLQDSATKGKRFENCRERLEMQVRQESLGACQPVSQLNMPCICPQPSAERAERDPSPLCMPAPCMPHNPGAAVATACAPVSISVFLTHVT